MQFKFLASIALSTAAFIAAEEQVKPLSSTALCTKDLEAVVYQPQTPALEYLNKISEEIKIAGPVVLWTAQADSFLENFELKYNVTIKVCDAFRNVIFPTYSATKSYYSVTSTANMNGSGYVYEVEGMRMIMYEFIVYNPFGELKYVMINMPLTEAPVIKK